MSREHVVHAARDVTRSGVSCVDQDAPSRQPFRRDEIEERFLLRVDAILGQRRQQNEWLTGVGIENRLAACAAVGVGEERLQVDGEQPTRAVGQSLDHRMPQLLEQLLVRGLLGEARRVRVVVHRGQHDLLLVVGQAGRHVGQPQEHRVADQVEERGWREAGALLHRLAVLAASAVAPVLSRAVVVLADGVLDEAVAVDPPSLLRPPELRSNGRAKPVEEMEEGGAVPAEQCAGEGERSPAGVGEHACRDALGGAPSLVFVDLVADEQVEEPRAYGFLT